MYTRKQLAATSSVFKDATIQQAVEILQNCKTQYLDQGYKWSGEMGGYFVIIASGILDITRGSSSSGDTKMVS